MSLDLENLSPRELRELVVKLQGEIGKPHFAGIRAAAEAAFTTLSGGSNYCVNWADLHVTEVLRTLDEEGEWAWHVHVEEGEDIGFCEEVAERLRPDWGTVRVVMEW